MNTCADHISEIKAEKEDQENENHILSDTALNQTPCIPNLIFRPVQLELPPFSAMTLAKKIFKVKMGQRCRSKKKQHKLSSRHKGKTNKKVKLKIGFSLVCGCLQSCPRVLLTPRESQTVCLRITLDKKSPMDQTHKLTTSIIIRIKSKQSR